MNLRDPNVLRAWIVITILTAMLVAAGFESVHCTLFEDLSWRCSLPEVPNLVSGCFEYGLCALP